MSEHRDDMQKQKTLMVYAEQTKKKKKETTIDAYAVQQQKNHRKTPPSPIGNLIQNCKGGGGH